MAMFEGGKGRPVLQPTRGRQRGGAVPVRESEGRQTGREQLRGHEGCVDLQPMLDVSVLNRIIFQSGPSPLTIRNGQVH